MCRRRWILSTASFGLLAAASGCSQPAIQAAPTVPPVVTVSLPMSKEVPDSEEFTGRTAAVETVDVRARVWGYLAKINFKEGMEVKKGDVLFEIDPRPYQAELDQAESKIKLAEAQLKYAEAEYKRNLVLRPMGAASQEDVEKSLAQRDTAQAQVGAFKADAAHRKLDLDFTKVIAPLSGLASRTQITEGNLVQAGATGSTLLTTIVSMDPMHAYFDVDERTMLKVQQRIREGKVKSAREAAVKVELGLANESGYPHAGLIDFVDNKVDPATGTLKVRGSFPNADRALSPGLFARIRVQIGEPYPALLVTERALGTDQGQKYLLTIDSQNVVQYRSVTVGPIHNGLRVILGGLSKEERVIINGLQRVRPGVTVDPKLGDMPGAPPAAKPSTTKG